MTVTEFIAKTGYKVLAGANALDKKNHLGLCRGSSKLGDGSWKGRHGVGDDPDAS